MLTPEEVAQYHETGQVTSAFRLDLADSLVEIDRSWIEFGKILEILDSVEQLLGVNLIVWAMECFRKKGERSKAVEALFAKRSGFRGTRPRLSPAP